MRKLVLAAACAVALLSIASADDGTMQQDHQMQPSGSMQHDGMQKGAMQHDGMQKDGMQHDDMQKGAMQHDGMQPGGSQHDGVMQMGSTAQGAKKGARAKKHAAGMSAGEGEAMGKGGM